MDVSGWYESSVTSTMSGAAMCTNAVVEHVLYVLGVPTTVKKIVDGVLVLETPQVLRYYVDKLYNRHLHSVAPGTWINKRLEWPEVQDCIWPIYECMVDVGAALAMPAEEDFGPGSKFALVEVSKAVAAAGKTTSSGFSVHVDNCAGVSGPVWTAIVYMDCTANGGGLEIFAEEGDNSQPIATIPCRGMVVMRGDVPHCPAPIEAGEASEAGKAGVRGAIIVQLRALRIS